VTKYLVPIGLKTDLSTYYQIKDLLKVRGGDKFTLLYVIEVPASTTLEALNELKTTDAYKNAVKKLDEAKKVFLSLSLPFEIRIEFGRDIAETIADIALNEDYDMIILVKRRKIPKFLGRSISKSLIGRVSTPILILSME